MLLRAAGWTHAAACCCDGRACDGGGAASDGGGGHGCEVQGGAGGECGMQIGLGRGATRGVLRNFVFQSLLVSAAGYVVISGFCVW